MKIFGSMIILAGLALSGEASAALPMPPALGVTAGEGLLQEVQYRDRRRPRCFIETRRIRFIDRFGRQRVRIVERRICR